MDNYNNIHSLTTSFLLPQNILLSNLLRNLTLFRILSFFIIGVIFFRDPLSSHPHHADIEALGRLCDVYQVPFATNPQSGEAILDYLLSGKADHELLPNRVLEAYVTGQKKVVEAG